MVISFLLEWNWGFESSNECEKGQVIPDDGLFDGIIKRHEELRVLSNATHKVSDKDIEAVGGWALNTCWDPTVVCLDVGLQERTFWRLTWEKDLYVICRSQKICLAVLTFNP